MLLPLLIRISIPVSGHRSTRFKISPTWAPVVGRYKSERILAIINLKALGVVASERQLRQSERGVPFDPILLARSLLPALFTAAPTSRIRSKRQRSYVDEMSTIWTVCWYAVVVTGLCLTVIQVLIQVDTTPLRPFQM